MDSPKECKFAEENPLHGREENVQTRSKTSDIISIDSPNSSESMMDIEKRKMELMEIEDNEYVMPDMWSKRNIGLYCQYAAVGLLSGSATTVLPFCAYVKEGEDQVCGNATPLVFLAWNFKIAFAIVTDLYKPFGYRRKAWMLLGWSFTIICLFILAVVPTSSFSVSGWLGMLMIIQGFVMLSDVPADGYCVQLGRMEPPKCRGTILATGQMVRFSFSMFAGLIQTFFLNGKSTSPKDDTNYWSFGLSMNGYYALLFFLIAILAFPIVYLEEMKDTTVKDKSKTTLSSMDLTSMAVEEGENARAASGSSSNSSANMQMNEIKLAKEKAKADRAVRMVHAQENGLAISIVDLDHDHENPTFAFFRREIWEILQNQTTLYLLIYVIGFYTLAGIGNQANVYMQYYVIRLTQNQGGIDSLTSYLALVFAIWLFKRYLINVNWRYTQWMSCTVSLLFGLMWIPAYHNSGGTMNAWYTIFVDLDRSFISGFAQVLYSLSVIELAKPGLEATTYELVVTVGNACLTISTVLGTQLLIPNDAIGCQKDDWTQCSPDSVNIASKQGYFATDGPTRYTRYSLWVFFLSAANASIWVWFLPRNVAHCAEWKEAGAKKGNSFKIGVFSSILCCTMVFYGFLVAFLLLNPSTACLKIVGGTGC